MFPCWRRYTSRATSLYPTARSIPTSTMPSQASSMGTSRESGATLLRHARYQAHWHSAAERVGRFLSSTPGLDQNRECIASSSRKARQQEGFSTENTGDCGPIRSLLLRLRVGYDICVRDVCGRSKRRSGDCGGQMKAHGTLSCRYAVLVVCGLWCCIPVQGQSGSEYPRTPWGGYPYPASGCTR